MNITSERKFIVSGIFIVVGLIYIIRLFYIQVIDVSYKLSANNNVLRYVTEFPSRGLIYDRKGRLMVYNEAVYDLMIIPKQVKNIDTAEFCKLIGISTEIFKKKFFKAKNYSPVKSSIFEKQLSAETYAAFQEKQYKFAGFWVEARTLRKYPKPVAGHTLGYIGEVDSGVCKKNPYYRMGDYIGISGIEQAYEKELRGKRGLKIQMVDVFNRIKGSFQEGRFDTLAVSGDNLITSLDAVIQEYGEQLMQNKMGSIAAIDPSTGEILAMVNGPNYDPNLMVGRVRTQNYAKMLVDPTKPLFNRAQQAYYPPGSTFKLINGLIGQQEGNLFPSTRYSCHRGYQMGSIKIGCHEHPSPLDLRQSVQQSCNAYYCNVFRTIIDNPKYTSTEQAYNVWRNYVLSFGVGKKLNIDLPHELRGMVPSQEYYDKYFGKGHWRSSTIVSLAIGQGELGVTPLQMANIMAVIANRGYYYIPHIVKAVGDKLYIKPEYQKKNYSMINPKYFDIMIDGMQDVVESGTAAASKVKGITICGKTGTAQNPHGKDHSLFVGFAPRENPKIAIAVMVENGGFGAAWAAPIASLMIEKYLTDTISRPAIEKRMLEGNTILHMHDPPSKPKPNRHH
jgi:penicillin-binding protein 2